MPVAPDGGINTLPGSDITACPLPTVSAGCWSSPGPACWKIGKPLATMFVWAQIPEPFAAMGSLEFSKALLEEALVAVSPGVGFGPSGEGYVRFALVENTHRVRQAVRGIRRFLRCG